MREVGDGNLNLVFIVEGPAGDLCVKQALPYVRLVGEGWPLDLKRAWFEHRAASIQSRARAGQRIPELLHFDERLYLIAMECCRPHVIMRRGMIEGVVYPEFAEHIAEYLAATLYYTSDMALPAAEKRELVAAFSGNTELCKITEDLIFTDPYMVCSRNRWTSPQLDDVAAEIRGDAALKRAVSALKLKFLSEAQALLHGDLHTGSIMVTAEDTKVIDPEFAVDGADGLRRRQAPGQPAAEPLQPARPRARARRARRLPPLDPGDRRGGLGPASAAASSSCGPPTRPATATRPPLFDGPEGRASLREAQAAYMRRLFVDALGFAGAAMIRRTLGLAHNIDMETIEDPDLRAACERRNLRLARELRDRRRRLRRHRGGDGACGRDRAAG